MKLEIRSRKVFRIKAANERKEMLIRREPDLGMI